LTWTRRKNVVFGSVQQLDEWYAVSPKALDGDVITVSQTDPEYLAACAVAVSGANPSVPFDDNPSVPGSAAGGSVSISTGNANDFIIGGYRVGLTASPTAGAGWTQDCGTNYLLVEHQFTSAAQSGLLLTIGTGNGNEQVGIGDAIVAAIQPVALSGAPVIGPLAAAAALALPTYSVLAANASEAISQLESALSALGQWQAAMAAQATSIEAVLTGLA
jgi:hypothetical protein